MVDVVRHVAARQRMQFVMDKDTLTQLTKFVACEDLFQLGLAHEHDLQEFLLIGLEIGEQADLFEDVEAEILRFVDDQHDIAAARDAIE
jgi:hypothetical protein